jgi:hypothetical protein
LALPKRPTKEEIESYHAEADDERTLAISVNSALLKIVNVQRAQREMTVRDFVIESILRNQETN